MPLQLVGSLARLQSELTFRQQEEEAERRLAAQQQRKRANEAAQSAFNANYRSQQHAILPSLTLNPCNVTPFKAYFQPPLEQASCATDGSALHPLLALAGSVHSGNTNSGYSGGVSTCGMVASTSGSATFQAIAAAGYLAPLVEAKAGLLPDAPRPMEVALRFGAQAGRAFCVPCYSLAVSAPPDLNSLGGDRSLPVVKQGGGLGRGMRSAGRGRGRSARAAPALLPLFGDEFQECYEEEEQTEGVEDREDAIKMSLETDSEQFTSTPSTVPADGTEAAVPDVRSADLESEQAGPLAGEKVPTEGMGEHQQQLRLESNGAGSVGVEGVEEQGAAAVAGEIEDDDSEEEEGIDWAVDSVVRLLPKK